MTRAIRLALTALAAVASLAGGAAHAQDRELDRSVYILFDTSTSMDANNRFGAAKAAVYALLDRLEAEGDYDVGLILEDGDRIALPLMPNNIGNVRSRIQNVQTAGAGNPFKTLGLFAANVLPGISSRCHLVVIVTDGADGATPASEAARIRSQCSRVFVVGVDLSDEGALQNTAIAGGGRYCNGRDSSATVKCMIGVFKRFQWDEGRKACLDQAGYAGSNPAPSALAAQRMGARGFADWTCIDFRTISAGDLPWSSILFNASYDFRGSRFDGMNLRGREIRGKLAGTSFAGADLASASFYLAPGSEGVSLANANAGGTSITGNGRDAGCVRGLDLTGTEGDPAKQRGEIGAIRNINLCEPRLPATWLPNRLEAVRLTGPRVAGDFRLAPASFGDVAIDQASFSALTVDGTINSVTGHDTALALNNVSAPRISIGHWGFKRLELKSVRAGDTLTVSGIGSTPATMAGANINRLVLDYNGSMSIDRAEIQTMATRSLSKLDMFAAPVRVSGQFEGGGGSISMRGDTTSISNLRVCVACSFNSYGKLRFEDMTLGSAVFTGTFTIDAVDSSFRGSRWDAARPNEKGSFTRVDISNSRFEGGNGMLGHALGFPMANVTARNSYFCDQCSVRIVDGADKIDFSEATIEAPIEVATASMRDLVLARAKGKPISGETGVPANGLRLSFRDAGSILMDRLDLSGTATHLSLLNAPRGVECRGCRFDGATIVAVHSELTLSRGSAIDATFEARTNALRLDGADLSRSKWPNGLSHAECINTSFSGAIVHSIMDSRLDRCRFDNALIGRSGPVERVESNGSDFTGATFERPRIVKSRFDGGSFARARFDSVQILESSFTSTHFDGGSFEASLLDDTSFEGVRFNGVAGPANIKGMAGVAGTLSDVRFTNVDFSGLALDHWKLQTVEMNGVNFARADLTYAKFDIMKMDDVRFDGATLDNASFDGKMSGLRFGNAKVGRMSISGELSASSLTGVSQQASYDGFFLLPHVMEGVDLRRLDLSQTILQPIGGLRAKLRDIDADGARISCSWKGDIVAAGPNAVQGSYTYASYSMGPSSHLAEGTCDAVGVARP